MGAWLWSVALTAWQLAQRLRAIASPRSRRTSGAALQFAGGEDSGLLAQAEARTRASSAEIGIVGAMSVSSGLKPEMMLDPVAGALPVGSAP